MKKYSYLIAAFLTLGFAACKKDNMVVDKDPLNPGAFSRFISAPNSISNDTLRYNFLVDETNTPYVLTVGVTNTANVDRVVNLGYISNSTSNGAKFSAPTSVTIPAGAATATVNFTPAFAQYATIAERDTVIVRVLPSADIDTSKVLLPKAAKIIMRAKIPPANDNCAAAINVDANAGADCTASANGNTIYASTSTVAAPSCATGPVADIWFKFTAVSDKQIVTLSALSGSADLAMALYSGACGTLAEVGCTNATSNQFEGLTVGSTYYVRVWTEVADASTSVNLCITSPSTAPCDEAAPILSTLLGDYANSNELWGSSAYGPYVASIASAVPLTATSATITVTNLADVNWSVPFVIDWSDPANLTTAVVAGPIPGSDAGVIFGATYAGQTIQLRPHANQPTGTYSACGQTFDFYFQVGIVNVGWSATLVNETLAR